MSVLFSHTHAHTLPSLQDRQVKQSVWWCKRLHFHLFYHKMARNCYRQNFLLSASYVWNIYSAKRGRASAAICRTNIKQLGCCICVDPQQQPSFVCYFALLFDTPCLEKGNLFLLLFDPLSFYYHGGYKQFLCDIVFFNSHVWPAGVRPASQTQAQQSISHSVL